MVELDTKWLDERLDVIEDILQSDKCSLDAVACLKNERDYLHAAITADDKHISSLRNYYTTAVTGKVVFSKLTGAIYLINVDASTTGDIYIVHTQEGVEPIKAETSDLLLLPDVRYNYYVGMLQPGRTVVRPELTTRRGIVYNLKGGGVTDVRWMDGKIETRIDVSTLLPLDHVSEEYKEVVLQHA